MASTQMAIVYTGKSSGRFGAEKIAADFGGALPSLPLFHKEMLAGKITMPPEEMRIWGWTRHFAANPSREIRWSKISPPTPENMFKDSDFVDADNGLVLLKSDIVKTHQKVQDEGKPGIIGVPNVALVIDPKEFESMNGGKNIVVHPASIDVIDNAVLEWAAKGAEHPIYRIAILGSSGHQAICYLKYGIGGIAHGKNLHFHSNVGSDVKLDKVLPVFAEVPAEEKVLQK